MPFTEKISVVRAWLSSAIAIGNFASPANSRSRIAYAERERPLPMTLKRHVVAERRVQRTLALGRWERRVSRL